MANRRRKINPTGLVAGKPEVAEKVDIATLEKLCAIGMGVKSIAAYMGVGKRTLDRYIQEREDVKEAYHRGCAKGQGAALGALARAMEKGNVMAIIFYLVNKFPEEWQSVNRGLVINNSNQSALINTEIPKIPTDQLKHIRQIIQNAGTPTDTNT